MAHPTLAPLFVALTEYCEAISLNQAAVIANISVDTLRRRLRGEQSWHLDEVFALAMAEARRSHRRPICQALRDAVDPAPPKTEAHPLLLPANLRGVLRLVGRLTTEIAETLEDGRIDPKEARRLLDLFAEMDELSGYLRQQLIHAAQAPQIVSQ